MTKVEKVKKLMEKYGITLNDLEDVDEEEETKVEEPKKEEVKPTEPKKEEAKADKVEESKTVAEPIKEEVKPVDNGTTEETKTDPYKIQFEDLNKKYEDLKALVEAQAAKTDKAYEILDAQGKKPEEEDYELAKKLGYQDIQPNIAESDKDGEDYASALESKKIR